MFPTGMTHTDHTGPSEVSGTLGPHLAPFFIAELTPLCCGPVAAMASFYLAASAAFIYFAIDLTLWVFQMVAAWDDNIFPASTCGFFPPQVEFMTCMRWLKWLGSHN